MQLKKRLKRKVVMGSTFFAGWDALRPAMKTASKWDFVKATVRNI